MLKTRLIGIKWLFLNLGFLKTSQILLEIALNKPKAHLIHLYFSGKKIKMLIESKRTDLAMLTEIFCFEAYEIKRDINPKLIIDGGANKGSTAIYFGLKYPNAKIHCYEPNIKIIPILKKNIELNAINAEVYNAALSDRDGVLSFEISENHQYSKLSDKDTKVKVRVISLNKAYANQKIDILKLDVEGEEEKIISSISYDKLSIDMIIQEIHYDRVNFDKIFSTLQSLGFTADNPYPQYKWLNSEVVYPILLMCK